MPRPPALLRPVPSPLARPLALPPPTAVAACLLGTLECKPAFGLQWAARGTLSGSLQTGLGSPALSPAFAPRLSSHQQARVSGHSRGPPAGQARAALSGAARRTRARLAGLAAPPPSLAGRRPASVREGDPSAVLSLFGSLRRWGGVCWPTTPAAEREAEIVCVCARARACDRVRARACARLPAVCAW